MGSLWKMNSIVKFSRTEKGSRAELGVGQMGFKLCLVALRCLWVLVLHFTSLACFDCNLLAWVVCRTGVFCHLELSLCREALR